MDYNFYHGIVLYARIFGYDYCKCYDTSYSGNMGAILEDVAWVSTGYAVANVIILPMSGWLGSRFGRKNYFLFSIILFTIASMLCGNSHTLTELVVFRILQGLAGGGLISNAQAILLETWPPEERGTATAIFGFEQ